MLLLLTSQTRLLADLRCDQLGSSFPSHDCGRNRLAALRLSSVSRLVRKNIFPTSDEKQCFKFALRWRKSQQKSIDTGIVVVCSRMSLAVHPTLSGCGNHFLNGIRPSSRVRSRHFTARMWSGAGSMNPSTFGGSSSCNPTKWSFTPWSPLVSSEFLNYTEVDEEKSLTLKEKYRRGRISQSNKGRVPWNKGRRHSAETIQRIRAKTIEAMRDPKIREKLRHYGQTQSKETRSKISNALTKQWSIRKMTKRQQETCVREWEEAIAEAARLGNNGDELYHWNSYSILKKQLQEEWKLAVQDEKTGGKALALERNHRKTPEHRLKISEAIKAKWADPSYRQTVYQGIRNHLEKGSPRSHKRTEQIAHNSASKSKTSEAHTSNIDKSLPKVISGKDIKDVLSTINTDAKETLMDLKLSKSLPAYVDPLAKEKLKIVRQIRANRVAQEAKRRKAAERAWILMEEAEKAARALEAAVEKDKDALVSLLETRKLLAEAAHAFQMAKSGKVYDSLSMVRDEDRRKRD